MDRSDPPTLGSVHAFFAGLSTLKSILLAAVCGVITLFAFAPFNIWPVYIVSITLLVWVIDGAREKENWGKAVFLRGWAFGFGFTLSSMHWLAAPFLVEPEKHIIFIWMPLILMPAGLGLIFGAGTTLAGFFWSKTPGRVFALAVSLSLSELLRGSLFGGFPWNLPGMIWAPGTEVSQLASLMGIWGLSVLTLTLAAAPAALADFRTHGSVSGRIMPVFMMVIIFVVGWSWGSQRLANAEPVEGDAVRIIDVQVDQSEKYPSDPNGNPEETYRLREIAAGKILGAYLTAMGSDFPDEPRLIVWPEAALPLPLLQDPNALDAVSYRLGDRTLIAGTARVDRYAGETPDWYNSLAILDTNSRLRGANAIYDKNRLVPFGELAAADFIPFGHSISSILPSALQQLATSGFTSGPKTSPLELDDEKTFLPLICYEALFSNLVRSSVENSDFLVNISIDSWFGGAIGPEQHYAHARYRAIETGRPLVRAANMGRSGVVDLYGREVISNTMYSNYEMLPLTIIDTTIPNQKNNTTYSCFGLTISLVLLGLMIMFTFMFKRSQT